MPLVISRLLEKGRILHIIENIFPTISEEKYIPLVNATNWTTTLETPGVALSLTKHPIIIPKPINKIDIGIDTNIVNITLILKLNPSKIEQMKNKIF